MQTEEHPTLSAAEFGAVIRHRRATQHFKSDEVPAEVIDRALELAGQAPSGYNFQPWRFLVVRKAERRAALQKAAFGQPKIGEAPVVIIAFAQRDGWKNPVDKILAQAGKARGLSTQQIDEIRKKALEFIGAKDPAAWLNKHVMIAFTHLMLAFEAQGWDTAPMEGFDSKAVAEEFKLPADSEVIALLAVGRAKGPEAAYPGRLAVSEIAFDETVGSPWKSSGASASV